MKWNETEYNRMEWDGIKQIECSGIKCNEIEWNGMNKGELSEMK